MPTPLRISALIVVLAAAAGVMGSTPGFAQFKSNVQLVALTVTVTDRAGRYVPGLPSGAFTVFEDGRRQTLAHFIDVDAPVDLGLLIDNSSSMRIDFHLVQQAASGLTRQMRTGDRVSLSGITSQTFVALPLTPDLDRVQEAIRSMEASGPTAIYEGLYILLRELQRAQRASPGLRRQAIVLLSDGLDNVSHVEFDHVLDSVRRADVVVYVVLLERETLVEVNSKSETSKARFAMQALARESGGRVFTPHLASELPAIYQAIGQELRSQYLLAYTPDRPDANGTFRRIAVGVQHPDVVRARTRAGYYAVATRTGRTGANDSH